LSKFANVVLGWAVPFLWAGVWAAISIPWIKREMVKERVTWEADVGIVPSSSRPAETPESFDSLKEPEP